MDFRFCII